MEETAVWLYYSSVTRRPGQSYILLHRFDSPFPRHENHVERSDWPYVFLHQHIGTDAGSWHLHCKTVACFFLPDQVHTADS
jgi:hypothetical protein